MAQTPGTERPTWLRHAGIGVEFAAAVAGFALVGYWVDRHYGSSPWGVLVGAALGLVGGTYNLIRQALAAFQQDRPQGTGSTGDTPSQLGDAAQTRDAQQAGDEASRRDPT